MILNGRIGQVIGPFDTTDLLSERGAISNFTPETTSPRLLKVGIQTTPGNTIVINGVEIRIGRTGIYELDERVTVKSLIFPNGADECTIVDFVY